MCRSQTGWEPPNSWWAWMKWIVLGEHGRIPTYDHRRRQSYFSRLMHWLAYRWQRHIVDPYYRRCKNRLQDAAWEYFIDPCYPGRLQIVAAQLCRQTTGCEWSD